MKERTLIILRLMGTQIFLVPLLIIVALLVNSYQLQLLLIGLTVLFITHLSGYWEFFIKKFKWIYSSCLGLLILLMLIFGKDRFQVP